MKTERRAIIATLATDTTPAETAARIGALQALLARLAAAVEGSGIAPAERGAAWTAVAAAMEEASRLLAGKLRWELACACRAPWLVMVAGGTNVGKSELFNAVVRQAAALPDARGAQTKHPLAFVHRADAEALRVALDGRWEVHAYAGPEVLNAPAPAGSAPRLYALEHDDDDLAGLCLIDAPDIDSDVESNRRKALALASTVDSVVYVTVGEKYNDRLCVDFLHACAVEGRHVHAVFNFATAQNAEARAHFEKTVLAGAYKETGIALPPIAHVAPLYKEEERRDGLVAAIEPTRERLLGEASRRIELKRELVERLGGIVLKRLDETATFARGLAEWHGWLERRLAGEREAADDKLGALYTDLPFYELDDIFRAAYAKLEVPYLDKALAVATEITVKAAAFFGWKRSALPTTTKLRRAREDAEDALSAELVAASHQLLDKALEESRDHPMVALAVARRRAEPLLPPHATLFARAEAERAELDAELARIEAEFIAMLATRPALRSALIAARFALMVGSAGAVIASAGLSTLTAVLGGAAAAAVRNLLELVGRKWIESSRARYFAVRTRHASAALASLHASLLAHLAPPIAPDGTTALAQSRGEMAQLLEALAATPAAR